MPHCARNGREPLIRLALLKPFQGRLRLGEHLRGQSIIMVSKAKKTVALPAVVDSDSLDAIRDGLLDAVEDGSVAVAADGVQRVSTNALFMLISAAGTAQRNNFDFAILQPSAAMTAAIERSGLDAQFKGMMRQ
ncbi:STAS domain-containing protein [Devosia sp. A8/3-2]|nr:STAS domain-containing protein [Devosia sp. A8/3-2]